MKTRKANKVKSALEIMRDEEKKAELLEKLQQPQHTPTPWNYVKGFEKGKWHFESKTEAPIFTVLCGRPEAKENAEFIVRACNSYTEMSNAIAWIEKEIEENGQGNLPDALCSFIRKVAEKI